MNNFQDGSTCLMGLVQSGNLLVASLGDCVGTLVHKDTTWRKVSEDHTTTARPDECLRIKAQQGFILRGKVQGELAVTRAFGNQELKRYISSEPECKEIKLSSNDDLLILSTDGLYNSMSMQRVVSRVC